MCSLQSNYRLKSNELNIDSCVAALVSHRPSLASNRPPLGPTAKYPNCHKNHSKQTVNIYIYIIICMHIYMYQILGLCLIQPGGSYYVRYLISEKLIFILI